MKLSFSSFLAFSIVAGSTYGCKTANHEYRVEAGSAMSSIGKSVKACKRVKNERTERSRRFLLEELRGTSRSPIRGAALLSYLGKVLPDLSLEYIAKDLGLMRNDGTFDSIRVKQVYNKLASRGIAITNPNGGERIYVTRARISEHYRSGLDAKMRYEQLLTNLEDRVANLPQEGKKTRGLTGNFIGEEVLIEAVKEKGTFGQQARAARLTAILAAKKRARLGEKYNSLSFQTEILRAIGHIRGSLSGNGTARDAMVRATLESVAIDMKPQEFGRLTSYLSNNQVSVSSQLQEGRVYGIIEQANYKALGEVMPSVRDAIQKQEMRTESKVNVAQRVNRHLLKVARARAASVRH